MDTGMSWFKNLIRSIIVKIVFNILTVIFSFIFLIGLIITVIINPTRNIFKVQQRKIPPKVLNDEIFGMHNYVKINGTKLHYVDSGNKSNTVILFLHGFPDFWFSWRHQIKEFSKNFRTIAVDLRGYGDSDKPSGCKNYRLNEITEEIKNLLDALNIERCILVGHDWGGLIAWQLAQLHSDRLLKYIIINAPEKSIFWQYLMTSFEQIKKSWYIFLFQSPYLPEIACSMNDLKTFDKIYSTNDEVSILNAEELEAYKYTFGKPGALTPPINYYRAVEINVTKSHSNKKKLIKTPGLMIVGDGDKALCKELLVMSAKIIGGDHMKISIIAKAGHFVHQEKPQEVNKAIAEFIY